MVPSVVRSWQVGQVLNASVTARPSPRTALLDFGNRNVEVQTRIPLSPGDLIKVRVASLQPRILLRLVDPQGSVDPIRSDALRSALPRQQSLAPLLANLAALLKPGGDRAGNTAPPLPPLPPQVREIARQLMERLPDARQMSTREGVRQAIQNSGTFAEGRLAQAAQQGSPPSPADIKLNLVRLLVALQTTLKSMPTPELPARSTSPESFAPPPLRNQAPVAQPRVPPSLLSLLEGNESVVRLLIELLTQTDGALARIQVSQLSSLGTQDQPTQVWIAEVPVRFGQQTDLVQFRIEHHRGGGRPEEAYWSITFAFELEELGPVRARVVYFQQELSAMLWAERESTAQRFKERLEALRKRIEQRGIAVKSVECHAGIPDDETTPPDETRLISEKA